MLIIDRPFLLEKSHSLNSVRSVCGRKKHSIFQSISNGQRECNLLSFKVYLFSTLVEASIYFTHTRMLSYMHTHCINHACDLFVRSWQTDWNNVCISERTEANQALQRQRPSLTFQRRRYTLGFSQSNPPVRNVWSARRSGDRYTSKSHPAAANYELYQVRSSFCRNDDPIFEK